MKLKPSKREMAWFLGLHCGIAASFVGLLAYAKAVGAIYSTIHHVIVGNVLLAVVIVLFKKWQQMHDGGRFHLIKEDIYVHDDLQARPDIASSHVRSATNKALRAYPEIATAISHLAKIPISFVPGPHFQPHALSYPVRGYYDTAENEIRVVWTGDGRTVDLLAHEFGHAIESHFFGRDGDVAHPHLEKRGLG